MRPSRISTVLATWCPHCVPPSSEATKRLSEKLGVPYRILDIDNPEQSKIADELVRKYGDNVEDYLVPQVFLEFPDGRVQHIFTGFSENPEITKRHWEDFFQSDYCKRLKS
ncbi:MAG: glutaredoxin [Nitrososphaerota archaeon]|nr:glutaredoxin [Nitrososphaerota archaeon]